VMFGVGLANPFAIAFPIPLLEHFHDIHPMKDVW
jgi:hypothetical protein